MRRWRGWILNRAEEFTAVGASFFFVTREKKRGVRRKIRF